MDYLSQRDHSEKELRTKLERKYTSEEIETAIAYGRKCGWLPNSEEGQVALAEKTAQSLHHKGKGIEYINHFLSQKGLPEIKADAQLELEKALTLVKNKFSKIDADAVKEDPAERQKITGKMGRFLMSRGFDLETVSNAVRKALYEEL